MKRDEWGTPASVLLRVIRGYFHFYKCRFLHFGFAFGRNDEVVVVPRKKQISPLRCEMINRQFEMANLK